MINFWEGRVKKEIVKDFCKYAFVKDYDVKNVSCSTLLFTLKRFYGFPPKDISKCKSNGYFVISSCEMQILKWINP